MNAEQTRLTLEALKAELSARVARTHKHIYERDSAVSADFAEQAVEMQNDDLVRLLDEEGRLELQLIDKALDRLKTGQYGRCLVCHDMISDQRLEAIPFAAQCYDCANGQPNKKKPD